jgi:hypothetical protein
VRLTSIGTPNTAGAALITRDAATPPHYTWQSGCRFYAVGALALLDSPGEYYVNATDGVLYFLPPGGALEQEVVVSVLSSVVTMDSAQHVSLVNLTLGDSQQDVLRMDQAESVHVLGGAVKNGGGRCGSPSVTTPAHGVQRAYRACVCRRGGASAAESCCRPADRCVYLRGAHSSVSGAVVSGCGTDGISIIGGDFGTLEHGNLSVVDNTIRDFSRWTRTYRPGLYFYGVGLYAARNHLSDAPHTGVFGRGNDCIFEHNVLERMLYETIDSGAFYIGRSCSERGNVCRFNTFDTVRATQRLAQTTSHQNAFYLDDQVMMISRDDQVAMVMLGFDGRVLRAA